MGTPFPRVGAEVSSLAMTFLVRTIAAIASDYARDRRPRQHIGDRAPADLEPGEPVEDLCQTLVADHVGVMHVGDERHDPPVSTNMGRVAIRAETHLASHSIRAKIDACKPLQIGN